MGLYRFLISNKLTLVLLIAFAAAMGYATFAENDFGTAAARAVVYDTWWFELILLGLGINFAGNIFRYNLIQRRKWPILLFHIAFIIILIGAAITRYTSEEGLMRIREGSSTNIIISQDQFLSARIKSTSDTLFLEKPLQPSALTPPEFSENLGHITITSGRFIPDAKEQITAEPGGPTLLQLVTTGASGRIDYLLKEGETFTAGELAITFAPRQENQVSIWKQDSTYLLSSPVPLRYMVMASQRMGAVPADSVVELEKRALYSGDGISFVVAAIHEESKLDFRTTEDSEEAKTLPDVLLVNVAGPQEETEVILSAAEGVISRPVEVQVDGISVTLSYGPKPIELPFNLYLRDFQLERYPGSTSPSSYASELDVIDKENRYPYRIYMNHVLDHGGYRFFQASYDLDEKGTVLSVNKDWWGTRITYLGYFLMGLGMLLALFGKGSRFHEINRKLTKLKATIVLSLVSIIPTYSQSIDTTSVQVGPLLARQYVDEGHASRFGRLLLQDLDGRIKPVNTLAAEFIRKVHQQLSFAYKDQALDMVMDCNQVFLSIHADPIAWQYVPFIAVDAKKGKNIFQLLQIPPRSHVAFNDFLDSDGNYVLQDWVAEVSRKKPAVRNVFDQEVIKVDERFNVMYQALSGNYLKMFPVQSDPQNTWYSYHFQTAGFSTEDSIFVKGIMPRYFHSVQQARIQEDWSKPDEHLSYIATFQKVLGAAVSPSEARINAELFYNKANLFLKLFPYFWFLGVAMLVVAMIKVFTGLKSWMKMLNRVGLWLTVVGLIVLSVNMIIRWFAGGHAPWSNGYEMTILVAWAIVFFALFYASKSDFVIPLACLFTGTLLFVAFLDWLNPEITNLVPVLKSYWLKIHVAIIVSSYAPLALSAFLGIMALWLMVSRRFGPRVEVEKSIRELTYINELSMTIGLFLLALGTFLGGVWANESWGRYWGWDPKETWALISIIIYAAVLHLRLVPALRGKYLFNLASVIAFGSIIMTSFGVNYYLAGLHSYAKGDPLPIPAWVYWVIGVVIVSGVAAYFNRTQTQLANSRN